MTFPAALELRRDVPYGPLMDRAHLLDILRPRALSTPLPAVVHFHGGGWQMFGKYPEDNVFLAEAGFCTVSANYRYRQEAPFPAQLEDARAVVRWVRAHAAELNVDASRVFAWGISAGGHIAALLGTALGDEASRVQGVGAVCAPTDLSDLTAWAREYADPGGGFAALLGARGDARPDLVRAASPLHHVSSASAPFLIVHGTRDDTVPVSQATRLHAALEAAGVPSTLRLLEGGNHFINETHRDTMQRALLEFFCPLVQS
jgi:acetyl esterase/lipase